VTGALPRPAPRGFTLVELLIGLGVSAIVIVAAMSLLMQQQRAYTVTATDRAQQEGGQTALKEIVGRLRLAGYGVDPNLVFDFGAQAQPVPRVGLPTNAVTFDATSSYACADPVRCRDRIDGSDELVFYSRNPLFSRVITAFPGGSIVVRGGLKRPIYRGQLLQPSCLGGNQARGYVKVSRTVLPTAVPADANELVTIQLEAGVVSASRYVFPFENGISTDSCWNLAGVGEVPILTQVDRYRYYVEWYSAAGQVVPAQTAGARPYLMLDQGLFDENGTHLVVPVAPDVEDLQISYYYAPAAAGADNRLVGAAPGILASDEPFPLSLAAAGPEYSDVPDAASRQTGHPANILAVRVAVVIRSPESDLSANTVPDSTLPAAGNRPGVLGLTNYRRSLFESTVLIRNMRSTYYVYPQVNSAGGDGLNLGGG
jgi:type IV pilus assembly protein PilW